MVELPTAAVDRAIRKGDCCQSKRRAARAFGTFGRKESR